MSDARRRRHAKEARRDARRLEARDREAAEDAPLLEEVRQALDGGHPLGLLGLVSMLVLAAAPDDPIMAATHRRTDAPRLADLVAGFIDVRSRETTALLTVLAELVVDDHDIPRRCRQEVATRNDPLPRWLSELPHCEVYRAARMTHVLGDTDDLLIAARLAGGDQLTCVVSIDHDIVSDVKDAFFVPDSIDAVLAVAVAQNSDPDTRFVEMGRADARTWVHDAMAQSPIPRASDSWPGCRALVRWLIRHLPDGGEGYRRPDWDSRQLSEFLGTFFASPQGAPFDRRACRDLLSALVRTGTGDPVRWSATRIGAILGASAPSGTGIAQERAVEAPELLRAYVPFAHAHSGIRDDLTAEALAVIDEIQRGG